MHRVVDEEIQGGLTIIPILRGSMNDSTGYAYQLGGVLTKRLQDLVATVSRMTSLLLSSVSARTAHHEDEDIDRAIKRSVEFDAMFARNHLYEIQRLLKDSKQLASGRCSTSELDVKVSAALKSVTQAIQVYAKHVSKGARVKYQQVVPIFQSITTIYYLLEQLTGQAGFPLRQELEVSCSYMKQLLLEMSTSDSQRVTVVTRKPARPKPTVGHKPSADLSMYSRHRPDWRRKTASLARAKFGPPSGKKGEQSSDIVYEKSNSNKKIADLTETVSQQPSFLGTEKRLNPPKEGGHRATTRGASEDHVATMVERIPTEALEDADLCLGDSEFEILKQLNGNHSSLQQENDVKSQKSLNELASDGSRSARGMLNNVGLICLTEGNCAKPDLFSTTSEDVIISENYTTLKIDKNEKRKAQEFYQNMIEYQKFKPQYKDGKALSIVDRLATHILTEIVLDFQKEEINSVIQTLYRLEFH